MMYEYLFIGVVVILVKNLFLGEFTNYCTDIFLLRMNISESLLNSVNSNADEALKNNTTVFFATLFGAVAWPLFVFLWLFHGAAALDKMHDDKKAEVEKAEEELKQSLKRLSETARELKDAAENFKDAT